MRIKVNGLIIVYIDSLRREYCYCYILKKVFESLGYHVVLASRRTLFSILKIVSPEILIVSHSFTLSQDVIVKIKKDTDIYLVSVEAVGDETYQYPIDFPETVDLEVFRGIFLWNDVYRDWVIKNRKVDPNKVFAFGSPRVELARYVEKEENNTIGFVGRFEFINTFSNRSVFDLLLGISDKDKHFLNRFFAEIEGIVIYHEIIKFLIKQGFRISIRPHPNESVKNYDSLKRMYGKRIIIDNGHDFIEWLSGVDIVVCTLSTALTEAFLLRKPIISIDGIFRENYMVYYDKQMSAYTSIVYLPSSLDDVHMLLQKKLIPKLDTAEMKAFLFRHYNIKEGDGLPCLTNIIRTIYGQRPAWRKVNRLKVFFVCALIAFIDLKKLMGNLLFGTFYLNFHYNYCWFIHVPSKLMKKVAKIMVDKFRAEKRFR